MKGGFDLSYHTNVLTDYPCKPRYYITHPWEFFKHAWLDLRCAWQRATRGWCSQDVWEMFEWLGAVLPEMFAHLRDHGCGHPCDMTENEWHRFLTVQQLRLIYAVSDTDNENEFFDGYFNMLTGTDIPDNDEGCEHVWRQWSDRENELMEARKKAVTDAMTDIAERFYDLWD